MKELEINKDCTFCELGTNKVGYINERGSGIVYKTGDDPNKDWFVILQPTTASDPKSGMNYQVIPAGHMVGLAQMGNGLLRANMADVLYLTTSVMGKVLAEDSGEGYAINELVNAKCEEKGKFPHMHFKVLPKTGSAAIVNPLDVGYAKLETFDDGDGKKYIKLPAATKQPLDKERWNDLFARTQKFFAELKGK